MTLMGRSAINGAAMTAAERQRRHRALRKHTAEDTAMPESDNIS